MKPTKWALRGGCAIVILTLLAGSAMASGNQGSAENPLVTLSYLNEVVIPAILQQVEEKLNAGAGTLPASGEVFQTVELAAGKSVTLSAGSQLLVRSGQLNSSDVLLDSTDGVLWSNGWSGMTVNHLYVATGDSQKVTAVSNATVMVLGRYTVA